MGPPKRSEKDVVDQMRESFRRRQREDADIFESTLEGLVIPLIKAGLVDGVEPAKKNSD
jgi:hypothetical protein